MQHLLVIANIVGSLIVSPVNDDKMTVLDMDSVGGGLSLDEVDIFSTVKENTSMRSLPSSVSMLSRERLEASHVTSVKGAAAIVPNFYMPDYGSRLTSAVYIRGIGSRINTPAIGLYVDNVPYMEKSSFDFNFYDIERVDVLRGPQGTLYGRNAMGGIIRVYTKNPFSYSGTDLNLDYATGDNHRRASVTHYHHISDKFAFSAGGYYEAGDGFFENTYTGSKVDNMMSGGGRIRGIYKYNDRLNIDFSLSYDYSDEGAYPYYYAGSQTTPVFLESSIGTISNNRESTYRRGMLNGGVNVEYRSPLFVMNAITGYQYLDDRMYMDQDFLSADIYSLEQKQRVHTVSEELTFKDCGKSMFWHWLFGVNAMYQSYSTQAPVTFYSDGLRWLESNINTVMPDISRIAMLQAMGFTGMSVNFRGDELSMNGEYDTPNYNMAFFHQSTFDITSELSLTAGVRFGYEKMSIDYNSPAYVEYGFRMPNANNSKMAVDLQNLSSDISYVGTLKRDDVVVLPKFAVKYDLGVNGNVYASASMGQRSGGYNIQMFSDLLQGKLRVDMMKGIRDGVGNYIDELSKVTPTMPATIPDPDNNYEPVALSTYVMRIMDTNMPKFEVPSAEQIVYKPEYSWNFEIGTHLNFLDRRVQLDGSLFLIEVRDQQIARFVNSGLGRMMVNAGQSRSYGVEVTGLWHPTDKWTLSANYGYTHAEFTDYDAGDGADYTGNFIPFVPQHTYDVDLSRCWAVSESGWLRNVTLGVNVRGAGPIYWDESNSLRESSYATLGARVALDTELGTIQLWGKNLTNSEYNTFRFVSVGRCFEQHCKPFQLGIDLHIRL
ncbi:MAG: TonB-dependent receptor [Bacteroidaceae bacterium]|nr:TonB-dependent receptor [Bacteroidaceae bacterium]